MIGWLQSGGLPDPEATAPPRARKPQPPALPETAPVDRNNAAWDPKRKIGSGVGHGETNDAQPDGRTD
jgi:hypothetical protein